MNRLRRVLILFLVPLMAWNASPHLVCRCSTGEIRYFCPELFQGGCKSTAQSGCCFASAKQKSCCRSSSSSSGSRVASHSKEPKAAPSIRSKTCECTPVVLNSAETTQVKHLELPAQIQSPLYLTPVIRMVEPISHSLFADRDCETRFRLDRLIVFTNRWLV